MKTRELIGAALDWAVAKCEGYVDKGACRFSILGVTIPHLDGGGQAFRPSTDWAQGGPIIERERINLYQCSSHCGKESLYFWDASVGMDENAIYVNGPTPLIAAMRCFVASKLGDEVEIPEELL